MFYLYSSIDDALPWEMKACVKYDLIPSVVTVDAVKGFAQAMKELGKNTKQQVIHIRLDSGMHDHGCSPGDLKDIAKVSNLKLMVYFDIAILLHFAFMPQLFLNANQRLRVYVEIISAVLLFLTFFILLYSGM